jgi:hypothetical protein
MSIKHFKCVIDHFSCNLRVFAAAHDLNMCRTQRIHATQNFFFASHFISRQFSFLLFKNISRTATFIPLNSEKIRRSN